MPFDEHERDVCLNNPNCNNYSGTEYSKTRALLLSPAHSTYGNYDHSWRTAEFYSHITKKHEREQPELVFDVDELFHVLQLPQMLVLSENKKYWRDNSFGTFFRHFLTLNQRPNRWTFLTSLLFRLKRLTSTIQSNTAILLHSFSSLGSGRKRVRCRPVNSHMFQLYSSNYNRKV